MEEARTRIEKVCGAGWRESPAIAFWVQGRLLTPAELRAVKAAAELAGKSASAWARDVLTAAAGG